MKKLPAVIIILCALTLFSFKADKKKMIIGKWRAAKMENSAMDSFFAMSEMYIDTIGKNNDAETNLQLYGTTNVDSLRMLMKSQLDSTFAQQKLALESTVFSFRKDGIAILSFGDNIDSCKWTMSEAGKITLQDLNNANKEDNNIIMNVLSLSEAMLKLELKEESTRSVITFYPERK